MSKIYNCCVKLSNDKWITYHSVNNLKNFTSFLDEKYGNNMIVSWRFYNVYDKEASQPSPVLACFQNGKKRNIPNTKTI